MQAINSRMRCHSSSSSSSKATKWPQARPAGPRVAIARLVAAAAAAEDYVAEGRQVHYDGPDADSGFNPEQQQYQQQPQQQQQYQPRGGGSGGGRGGGRGRYQNNNNYNRQDGYRGQQDGYRGGQQRNRDYGNAGNNAAGYDGPRGPVSYDEGDGGSRQYNNNNRRGGYGGRGGGRGRGGYDKPNRRQLSPEATAVNEALAASTTWRQLNTVLEQQSRPGMPGLDAFQLVDIMMRLTRKEMAIPTQGDDLADFQQFVASVYGWLLERLPTMKSMQVCNAVFAMGKLNLYNAELCDALLQVASQQMTGFNAQQYAKFLSGLAALNLAPPADIQEVLCDVQTATRIVGSAMRDDLGVILSSCQRLGVVPGDDWQAFFADAFIQSIDTKEKAAQVRTDFFVKPLVGLAGMGWRPDQGEWQIIIDAAEVLMPLGYFRARQLLETAWALAQFGQPVSKHWAEVFNYQLWRQSQFLGPSDIGALLYSMAYIRATPSRGQLKRMLDNMKSRVDQAVGDDFANVLLALAQFKYTPLDDEFDDMLAQLQVKLPSCTPEGLNNIIAALPAMGTGVRLRAVVDSAVARYDALLAEQQQYAAAPAEEPAAEPVA